jgi:hypothetical protein
VDRTATHGRRALSVSAVVLAALLVAAPAAEGTIRLEQSIAGVRLGMTRGEVVAVAGKPDRVRVVPNPIVPFTVYRYGAGSNELDVTFFAGRRVTAVTTTRAAERTRSGIGRGSTIAALRRLVPGLRCVTAFRKTICARGDGTRTTQFIVESGRVVESTVAFVTPISP